MQGDWLDVGSICIILGITALAFLVYTLLNLERLQIPITHPRVIVELLLFLIFTLVGLFLRTRE